MSAPGRSRVNYSLSHRCVNCSLRIAPNLRRRQIEELPYILFCHFFQISSDDILCVECFVLLQNQTASNSNLSLVSPALGHLNICYACGLSIASRRTHRVSQDCPQRNVILRWTPAHHVLHLERVCLPCWAAASRQVRRQPVAGSSQHTVESAPETGIMDGNIITDMMIPVPPPLPPL